MKKLLIIMLVLLMLFVAGGLLLPKDIHVERSITVNRPATTVFRRTVFVSA